MLAFDIEKFELSCEICSYGIYMGFLDHLFIMALSGSFLVVRTI